MMRLAGLDITDDCTLERSRCGWGRQGRPRGSGTPFPSARSAPVSSVSSRAATSG